MRRLCSGRRYPSRLALLIGYGKRAAGMADLIRSHCDRRAMEAVDLYRMTVSTELIMTLLFAAILMEVIPGRVEGNLVSLRSWGRRLMTDLRERRKQSRR